MSKELVKQGLLGQETRFQKGVSGNPAGRPPKAKATHLALAALCEVGLKAAKNIVQALDSEDDKLRLDASKFTLNMLQKAGKLEREIEQSELDALNQRINDMSDDEVKAALASLVE